MTAKQELRDIVERLDDEEAALWLEAVQAGDAVLLAAASRNNRPAKRGACNESRASSAMW